MQLGDVVTLTDARGENTGKVTAILPEGMVVVRWESGVAERVPEKELKKIGVSAGAPLVTATGKVLTDADVEDLSREAEEGYELDDPKHPTFRERLSALWDSRPGK